MPVVTKHTPGPWTAYLDDDGKENSEIRAGGSLIGIVYGVNDFPCITDEDTDATAAEMAANARLIAAAPDLLEACRAVLGAWDAGAFESSSRRAEAQRGVALDAVKAAVRKATEVER